MSISISKDVLAQELAGETVLLDLASESYFGLVLIYIESYAHHYFGETSNLTAHASNSYNKMS